MKRLIMALLFVPGLALAESDLTAEWSVFGIDGIDRLVLDMSFGSTIFMSASGGLQSFDGITLPVIGSCFLTATDTVQCNLHLGRGAIGILEVSLSSLGGTFKNWDVNGDVVENGTVAFIGTL